MRGGVRIRLSWQGRKMVLEILNSGTDIRPQRKLISLGSSGLTLNWSVLELEVAGVGSWHWEELSDFFFKKQLSI